MSGYNKSGSTVADIPTTNPIADNAAPADDGLSSAEKIQGMRDQFKDMVQSTPNDPSRGFEDPAPKEQPVSTEEPPVEDSAAPDLNQEAPEDDDSLTEETDPDKKIGKFEKLVKSHKAKKKEAHELKTRVAELESEKEDLAPKLEKLQNLEEKEYQGKQIIEKLEYLESDEHQETFIIPAQKIADQVSSYIDEHGVDKDKFALAVNAETEKEREEILSKIVNPVTGAKLSDLISQYKQLETAREEVETAPLQAQKALREEIAERREARKAQAFESAKKASKEALKGAVNVYKDWDPTKFLFEEHAENITEMSKEKMDYVVQNADPGDPKWVDYVSKLAVSASCNPNLGAEIQKLRKENASLKKSQKSGYAATSSRGSSAPANAARANTDNYGRPDNWADMSPGQRMSWIEANKA